MNKADQMNPLDQDIQRLIEMQASPERIVAGDEFLDGVMARLDMQRKASGRIAVYARNHKASLFLAVVLLINVIAVGLGLQPHLGEFRHQKPIARNAEKVLFIDPGQYQLYNHIKSQE